jgi:ankyrin repeat protein
MRNMMDRKEVCNQLLSSKPTLAILYYKCITSEYEANIDDIKLVLASLPQDFSQESIAELYFLAEKSKANLEDPEVEADLEEIKAFYNIKDITPEKAITEFIPNFNHNINKILKKQILNIGEKLEEELEEKKAFNQYSEALLFADKIFQRKEEYLNEFQKNDDLIDKEQNAKKIQAEKDLKNFSNSSQNAHDSQVEQNASKSFDRLKRSYPACNINQNLAEIKTYISNLSDNLVSSVNKKNALKLLNEMNNNPNYGSAKERLVYVWEALKDETKLTGTKAKEVQFQTLQKNLKETLIQQLASAETNYSVEGKSFSGTGRSCPGGTKNIILQVLDDYHADVNFGYSFKGDFAPKLNSELANARFKELFLVQLSKTPPEVRKEIILSWNNYNAISDQVDMSEKNRIYILNAMNEAETELLKEYKNSQYIWHKTLRRIIYSNLSTDKASLLKPEIDFTYEYKQFLASKNFSYKEMNEAIANGGNIEYAQDLIAWIKTKKLSDTVITEDILKNIIPLIKKDDLINLSENILIKEYKEKIEPVFNKLSEKEKNASAIWNQEGFLNLCSANYSSSIENSLLKDLQQYFNKKIQVKYSDDLKQNFNEGNAQRKKDIAQAIINGKVLEIDKADKNFISEIFKLKQAELEASLTELKKQKNSPERAQRMNSIAAEQESLQQLVLIVYKLEINQEFSKNNIEEFFKNHKDNQELIKLCLQKKDKNGDNLLMWAVKNGNTKLVEKLLEKGATPNIASNKGETPLIWAVKNQRTKMLEERQYGETHLYWARKNGPSKIIRELLEKGADPNLVDEYGNTPMVYAATHGLTEVVEELLEKGADPNLVDKYGNTPLVYAATNGYTEIVEKLLEKGAEPNIANNNGDTLLNWAAKHNNLGLYKELIAHGADANHKIDNKTAYDHLGFYSKLVLFVEKIFEKPKPTINKVDTATPEIKEEKPSVLDPAVQGQVKQIGEELKGQISPKQSDTQHIVIAPKREDSRVHEKLFKLS